MKVLIFMRNLYASNALLLSFSWMICLITSSNLKAQTIVSVEAQTKADYLLHILRFVSWPETKDPDHSIRVAVLGENPFGNYLKEQAADKQIAGKNVIILQVSDLKEMPKVEVVYMQLKDTEQVKEALAFFAGKSVLTIADTEPFSRFGGIIKYFKEEGAIRIQINHEAAKAARLDISSKLLSVAKIYKPAEM